MTASGDNHEPEPGYKGEIMRSNERYKAISGVAVNLGTALFGAGFVKGYSDQAIGYEALGWISLGQPLYGEAGSCWAFWKRRTEMFVLPPVVAELFPAIGGVVAMVGLWGLANLTKRYSHHRD